MSRPNILIVNDDGIGSPGLRVLAEAAAQIGDVWVVAPERQCSGMSQKISIFEEIPIRRRDLPVPVRGLEPGRHTGRLRQGGGEPFAARKGRLSLFRHQPGL